jgi:hypothetical protein
MGALPPSISSLAHVSSAPCATHTLPDASGIADIPFIILNCLLIFTEGVTDPWVTSFDFPPTCRRGAALVYCDVLSISSTAQRNAEWL